MLEKIFKLKEKGTNVTTEFIAGLTTFMSISYIIFINPNILSKTGMDFNSVFMATILSSIVATLFMGLFAHVPYAESAGLGINALFTYTICMGLGFTWQQGLAMVFICGIINVIVTITSIRKKLIKAIPSFMKEAITVGIGLFIAYIGFKNSGFIQFSVDSVTDGIAKSDAVVPGIVNFNNPSVVLALIGLFLTSILVLKKVKGGYLIGIVLTTIIGIPLGVTQLPNFAQETVIPSLKPTFLQLDFVGLFNAKAGIITVLMTIFTLCISDIFDTIGTFIGTGKKSGIFKIDEKGNMSKEFERAMFADSIGTVVGSLLGTSNITTYVESSAGIEAGGRTGLTAVFVAMFFALSIFLSPIVSMVPMAAISPILILIGVSMMTSVSIIDWNDINIAIPSFFLIVLMPFAYSITVGIEAGFIFYVISSLVNRKNKENKVSPIIYIFTILFVIDFIYKAMV